MRLLAAIVALCALCFDAVAEKPRGYTAHPIEAGTDYSQRARDAFAAGVWIVEEAENDAADTAQAPRAYERALRAFTEAVAAEPRMYEALSYVGYCERKLGRYDAALRAYAAALREKPDYVYAIEYEAEAYLGLGNFDRARFNYLRLYALDTELAQKLLDAMRAWSKNAAGPDADAIRQWIRNRET